MSRIGRFTGLVLSVAIAFQLVAVGSQRLVGWAVDGSILPAGLALPNVKADCARAGAAAPPAPVAESSAHVACLQLGFALGIAAASRNAGDPPGDNQEQLRQQRALLAQRLGVETPELPPIVHAADALHEFEVYLEADPQCTAIRLSKTFTPTCGPIYQFGGALGHAWFYRSRMPQLGPLFVAQLTVYGNRGGVAPALWAPLAADLSGLPPAEAQQRLNDAVGAIERSARLGK